MASGGAQLATPESTAAARDFARHWPSSLLTSYPFMRPLGWIGVALIVAGGVILAMRGVSYTKDRNEVEFGPLHVATVEKGFIPPIVGVAAVVLGAGLLFAGRRRGA